MVAIKKNFKKIPKDAIIINELSNGDVVYVINFEFDGRDYHHVNHVGPKGGVKSNVIYSGKYQGE